MFIRVGRVVLCSWCKPPEKLFDLVEELARQNGRHAAAEFIGCEASSFLFIVCFRLFWFLALEQLVGIPSVFFIAQVFRVDGSSFSSSVLFSSNLICAVFLSEEFGVDAGKEDVSLFGMTGEGEKPLRSAELCVHVQGDAFLGVYVRLCSGYVSEGGVDLSSQGIGRGVAAVVSLLGDSHARVAAYAFFEPGFEQEVYVIWAALESVVCSEEPLSDVAVKLHVWVVAVLACGKEMWEHFDVGVSHQVGHESVVFQVFGFGEGCCRCFGKRELYVVAVAYVFRKSIFLVGINRGLFVFFL